jgi:type II secretory pathway pseudopilin PulG
MMENRALQKSNLRKASAGFTLLETLVALTVLIVGVVGAFAAISHSAHISPLTRQQLTATNLAQEAIEEVRNIRDNRLLTITDDKLQNITPAGWDDWTQDLVACDPGQFHSVVELPHSNNPHDPIDITKGWGTDCLASGDAANVYIDPVSGYFANKCFKHKCNPKKDAGWRDTGFRRVLDITKYVCASPPCQPADLNNSCTNNCTEVRVKVKVYWGTDTEPATCPSDNCIIVEDRLANWSNYLGSFTF